MACNCGSDGCSKSNLPFSTVLIVLSGLIFLSFVLSCKQKPDPKSFDQSAMLTQASTIIQHNYADFNAKADVFSASVTQFTLNPDAQTLSAARVAFKSAWLSWQYCASFEFGPAEQRQLRAQLNTFPTDTSKIAANIAAEISDLSPANQFSAKGFPALDFLLFGTDSNAVLSRFISGVDATLRKNYLNTVTADVKNLSNAVNNSWQSSGGNYAATFTTNTGLNSGSSISLLVNQFNFDLEWMKNAQVGIPLGKKTLGTPLPEKCEAFYSGYSLELISAHLDALDKIFQGNFSGANGYGLDDALADLDAKSNGIALNQLIRDRFVSAKNSLNSVTGILSTAVVSNPAAVEDFYTQLIQLVIYSKSDMASAMAILITYQDADGD